MFFAYMSNAWVCRLAPSATCAVTVESVSLRATEPLAPSTAAWIVSTLPLKVAVCSDLSVVVPLRRVVLPTPAPPPMVAVVEERLRVLAIAPAPATTPPLPENVSA